MGYAMIRAMNLKQIETFISVAELGSFSKAAALLGTAQPALSRQIRGLEVELHEHLFERHGRGVTLTEAGQRLLAHGRSILQRVEEARADFGDYPREPSGHLALGLPPSLARRLTLPLIRHFQAHLPKARLEIVEGFSASMADWLVSGRIDLCLLYDPPVHPSLEIASVRQERLCLIGRHGSLPAQDVGFDELPGYRLILPQRGQTFRAALEAQAARRGIKLDIAWEVSSVPVILDLLSSGLGYAVLTEGALASHQGDTAQALEARLIRDPEIACQLCLAQRGSFRETLLLTRVKQALRTVLAAPAASRHEP